MGILRPEVFKALFPRAPVCFIDELNKYLGPYGINTVYRLSSFLAQAGIETGGFTAFEENLGYDASGLMRVFPSKYGGSPDLARAHGGNPILIANYMYGPELNSSGQVIGPDKKGLGNNEVGDGWKFRGHGILQVTGKGVYNVFAKQKGMSLDDFLKYSKTFEGLVEIGFMYWKYAGLNSMNGDMKKIRKKINPGQDSETTAKKDKLFTSSVVVIKGGRPTYVVDNYWHTKTTTCLKPTSSYLPANYKARDSSGSNDNDKAVAKDSKGNATPTASNPESGPVVKGSNGAVDVQSIQLQTGIKRDNNWRIGSRGKTKYRVKLSKNFIRDMFACKCCGSDTVDANLVVVLQRLQNKISNNKITIETGIVCPKYKGKLLCSETMAHMYGRAVDIKVDGMASSIVVRQIESIFGELVYCYSVNNELTHLDVMNC